MARIRTIKPEFWRSPDIMELNFFQRLLYIGLWNLADDEGRGKFDPASIAADLFLTEFSLSPHGTITEVSNAFSEYSKRGMITIYEVKKRQFFQILNWADHQKPNRPSASKLPAPTSADATFIEGSVITHAQLTESSLPEQGTGNREHEKILVQNPPLTETHTTPPLQEKKPPTPQPNTEPTEEALDHFTEFWEHYPRKQHKQEALKEFAAQIETTDPRAIIAGADRLANDPNLPEKRFIPLPEKWLHGQRWKDEDPYPYQPTPWTDTDRNTFLDSLTHFPSFQAENDF
ncbi:hypothetical protein SEA_PSONYX_124 [Corynebacterium phage PSonyx]|nr:hypothetical protein SEA_PSONYX_124 [Corynebacterium phage PSonyx]